jgi:eukaryotic-like serine/threonine-protein kinase
MLSAGTRLGPYEIVSSLGAGGMGEVYRARDTKLERDIAVKVLPVTALSDPHARTRLAREARLVASLNHPSICTVHDVGEGDGLLYVAMELIEGPPLSERIPRDGLPSEQVLRYAIQIADALAHAHERGIVHRDLKSANVLITPQGRVKVLDFGLAARHQREVDEATRSAAAFDAPGIVAGTIPYMSPEALRGAVADPRSDVWSFGILLYEMASGRRPFTSRSSADLTSAILRDDVPAAPANVAPGLAAVISRCLQKEPDRRYADAGELHAALGAVQAGARAVAPTRPPTTRGAMVVGAIALILAAIAGIVVPRSGTPKPAPSGSARDIKSLAVLPLEDLSGDAAQDYLSDGLTEELITRLSKVGGLSVTSRSMAMRFKRSGRSPADVAKELGVQAVVEGTVARSADRVRVTARLVDTAGTSLWAERYDRPSSDAIGIQADVASSIADAIRTNITPKERERLTSVSSSNPQAYDFYLRGRFHAGRESPESIRQAIDFFERAVAADPGFAPAHAELARAYSQRLFYVAPGDFPLQERAFVEIERALAIDPDLDIAYLARGLLLWQPWNRFPHERAIAEYRRAIALNPNFDEAHHQLALVYVHVGLLDEAMVELQTALRINPANTLAHFREGVVYLYSGKYDEAANVFRQTAEAFQPPLRSFQLADALFHLGRKDEARNTAAAYLQGNPNDLGGMNTAMLAMIAADRGDVSRAGQLADEAVEKGKGYGHFHHTAFTLARAAALAGQSREALRWLEQAAGDGYPCYPAFMNDKALDRIRTDRSFQDFLSAQRESWQRYKKLAQ